MNAPLGSGLTNTTPNSLQTIIVPDTAKNGHYYNKSTGKYEGHLATKTGDVNDVYACTGKIGDGENATYSGAVKLDIIHTHFQTICTIFEKEAGHSSEDELEIQCLAHAAANHARKVNHTIYAVLMSAYSSVSRSDKLPLPDSSQALRNLFSRKYSIEVLTNTAPDPTHGAEYWDGTDFLAWGSGTAHPNHSRQKKFEGYATIVIPKTIYQKYLNANLTATHRQVTEGSAAYRASHRIYRNSGDYVFPHPVFENPSNINSDGDIVIHNSDTNTNMTLAATIAAGQTVFWKEQN